MEETTLPATQEAKGHIPILSGDDCFLSESHAEKGDSSSDESQDENDNKGSSYKHISQRRKLHNATFEAL